MAVLDIHVSGSGQAIRRAERAMLILQVCASQLPTAKEATSAITRTANLLRESIEHHCPIDDTTGQPLPNAAISHYSITTLDTSQHRDARKELDAEGNRIYDTSYSARVDFHIKFSDFSVLDTLATRFSAMDNVRIQRINWCLTDDTLASICGGARKEAAQDAIQKAWDYASVFCGISEEEAKRRVKPVELKESSSYRSQSNRPWMHRDKRQMIKKHSSEDLMFQPEDVTLDAGVSAKFVVEV